MKISIVTPGISGGGTERVATILANGFAERGHDICIVCCYYDNREYELDDAVIVSNVISEYRGFRGLIYRSLALIKALHEQKTDVVLSFVAPEMVIPQLFCPPTIQTLRNDPWHFDTTWSKRLFIKRAFSSASKVVFQTHKSMEFYPKSIREKGIVLNNPLEVSHLPLWNKSTEAHEFIAAARLNAQKNYPMMIRAFKEFHDSHPDWILTIYGEGDGRLELEKLIAKLGLAGSVRLPGRSMVVHEHMAKSSAFLLSSDYEGVSNSMLEALCIGMPCIVTDHSPGGAREYIEDGVNGLLVKVGDYHGMARAMERIANEPGLGCRLGERALLIRNQVDEQTVVGQWEKVLLDVVDNR